MSTKILVIYDNDERYVRNLMEYLSRKDDFPYQIEAYTEESALIAYTTEKIVDVLLVSESSYSKNIINLPAGRIYILNESGVVKWDGYPNINKYQSCQYLVQEIMDYYVQDAKESPMKLETHKNTKIIGFFSPVRRCCQTTTGLTLGQLLAQKHKTLYLNFENFSGFSEILNYGGEKDIADLVYYMESSPGKAPLYLNNFVKRMGELCYLPPVQSVHNMLLISGEQWMKLLSMIINQGIYEYVVLDLTDGIQGLFEILRNCDQIYTVVQGDKLAKAKIEQYEQLLQLYDYQDVLSKTRKTKLPYMKEIPDAFYYRPGGELGRFLKKFLKEDGLCESL